MNIDYTISLSEEFIRNNKDKVDWDYISKYQKLSEDSIIEFEDYVVWYYISGYQKLSEDFIREFKDKVNWECISEYQKLNIEFIKEFKNYIYWELLLYNFGLTILKAKGEFCIKSNNYNSGFVSFDEFINLALKLISLNAFQ